ncbi:Hypothetical protein UVM_LOCUS159 [uncultured virus]|nr:Hypothetical protein UVM_LOCUS159 [uncultured virus]
MPWWGARLTVMHDGIDVGDPRGHALDHASVLEAALWCYHGRSNSVRELVVSPAAARCEEDGSGGEAGAASAAAWEVQATYWVDGRCYYLRFEPPHNQVFSLPLWPMALFGCARYKAARLFVADSTELAVAQARCLDWNNASDLDGNHADAGAVVRRYAGACGDFHAALEHRVAWNRIARECVLAASSEFANVQFTHLIVLRDDESLLVYSMETGFLFVAVDQVVERFDEDVGDGSSNTHSRETTKPKRC